MTAEQLRKDTESRLESIFHIRVKLDDLAEHKRLCVIASLLHAYDTSWQVQSLPSLIGKSNIAHNEEKTSATTSKKDVAALKRWMIVMGIGYLTQGSSLGESKKFTHLCTILMDKIEQRHGSKLKPMIRQIIGKQSRLNVKNVSETNRQNQNMDSSETSSSLDSQENPFQGRSIPRSAQEGPPAPGRDLPRTPLTKTNIANVPDQKEENVEKKYDESLKQPQAKLKLQGIENSKPESDIVAPPRNIIPSGKNELNRTPMVGEKQLSKPNEPLGSPILSDQDIVSFKHPPTNPKSKDIENSKTESNLVVLSKNVIPSGKNELPRTPMVGGKQLAKAKEPGVPCDYEVPTKFGPDDSPRTPEIDKQRLPKRKISEEREKISKNMIPCGKNIIPRTPFNGGVAEKKEEDTDKSPKNLKVKDMKNFIPCGKNIPRTPFLENDKIIPLEDTTELQTIKTFSAEVNVAVIVEEPTRKLSKLTLLTDEMQKVSTGNEELKTTDNLPFEESQTSKKSVKAKKTALRPTSKKKNGENTDANSEKHIEESNEKIATADNKVNVSVKTSKSKDGKIKQNKKVELLSKSEQELPTRRRSPRLIQTASNEEIVEDKGKQVPLNINKTLSSPQNIPTTEKSRSDTARQRRLERPTKTKDAKDAEKDVKLPQIEDKSKTATSAVVSTTAPPPSKRKGKKKVAKAKMDVSFDVIEELVPPLKMAKGKDGGNPSERISDEVYSTPLVKTTTKVGMARRQRKTKKSQAQMFSIQDEIFQTPSRKH